MPVNQAVCMGARASSPATIAGEDARAPIVDCKDTQNYTEKQGLLQKI